MANDVDKQVVAVEFDNSKFDKNVKKSSSTLDEFKSKLRFEDASKSLEAVAKKLNKLDAVTFTVINNITNRVINLGVQLVKSLSVNNIAAGWDKFGNKTIATATIMAQSVKIAGKELTDYAEKTEAVNEQLEKLLWFTDETSYNFTDMVESIGKFTAAGVDLDVAAEAMQGIATWAAKSGQNAMTASRAMYQLAQTLGKGYVQLMDWRSIQNANMDTEEFRKTVLETAEAIGELRKQGNEYITKTGKKITAKNFTDTLSEKWFTSDVLTKTLKKYSAAVDEIYKIAEDSGKTAYEIIQEFGDELDPFGVAAFKAAQECRTLGDALNSIKDAVSTGFMTTFETIVGQYDEAKEIWSDLADSLYDAFVESGNFRNSILKTWRALEGNQDIFGSHGDTNQGAFWNIYDAIHELRSIASDAWRSVFPKSIFSDESDQAQDLARQLKDTTSRIREFTKNIKETIKNDTALQGILKGIAGIAKVILATGQGIYAALQPVINVVKDVLLDLFDRFGVFGDRLSNNEKVIEVISSVAEKVAGSLSKIMDFLDLKGNIGKFLDFIASIFNGTFDFNSFADGVVNFFVKMKDGFVSLMDTLRSTKGIGDVLNAIIDAFKNFFNKIKSLFGSNNVAAEMASSFGGGLSGGAGMAKRMMAPMKAMGSVISETLKEGGEMTNGSKQGTRLLNTLSETVYVLGDLLISVLDIFKMVISNVSKVFKKIAEFDVNEALEWLKNNWLNVALWAGAGLIVWKVVDLIWDFVYATRGLAEVLSTASESLWKIAKAKMIEKIGYLIRSIGMSLLEMTVSFAIIASVGENTKEAMWRTIGLMSAMTVMIVGLTVAARLLSNSMTKLDGVWTKKKKSFSFSSNTGAAEVSGMILAFGTAMLQIALAMKLISTIKLEDFNRANTVLLTIGTVFVVIAMVMFGMAAVSKENSKISVVYPTLATMIGFALALLAFAKTIKTLATIDVPLNKLISSMLGVMGIIGMLTLVIYAISYASKKGTDMKMANKLFKSFSLLMGSLLTFALAVKLLASIDPGTMWSATASLMSMVGLMAGFVIILSLIQSKSLGMLGGKEMYGMAAVLKGMAALTASLVLVAIGMAIMSEAINKDAAAGVTMLASIGMLTLFLAAELGILALLDKFTKSDPKKYSKNIMAMAVLNTSLVALALAVRILSGEGSDLGKTAAVMALMALVIMSYSVVLLALRDTKDSKGTGKVIGAMISTMVAVLLFAGTAALLTLLDLGTIAIAMVELIAILSAWTLAMTYMSKASENMRGGALLVGLLGVIGAIVSFGIAMKLMEGIDWANILVAGLAISGILLAFAGALMMFNAADIKPSTLVEFGIGLITIAGGLTALLVVLNLMTGENLLQIGLGFLGICAGLTLLAVIAKFIQPSVMALMGLGLSMGVIAVALYVTSAAINAFIQALLPLADNVSLLGDIIITTLTSICNFVIENTGLILQTVVTLIELIVQAIVASAGTIMEGVVALITKLAESFDSIKDPIISIINNVFDILDAFIPRLFKTLTKLIDGIIQFLRTETPKFVKWLSETITVVLTEVRDNIRNWAEMLFDIVWGIISTFATKLLTKIGPIVNYFFDFIKKILDEVGDALVKRGAEMGATFVRFGKNLMKGLWNGMMGGLGELVKGIPLIGGALESFFKETLQIHSPSRMTAEMGVYLMQGFGVGMEEEMNHTKKETTNILAGCMTQAMNDAYDIINSEDDGLVIRPVVDLSGVQTGANSISSMMSSISGGSVSVSSNLVNSAVKGTSRKASDNSEIQNGSVVNNEGDTYNVTYNVTTNDPEELVKQTDAALQRERMKAAYAKGGAY